MPYDMPTTAQEWNDFIRAQGWDPSGNNVLGDAFRNQAAWLNPEAMQEIAWLTNYFGPQSRSLIEQYVTAMNDPGALAAQREGNANMSYEAAGQGGNLLANSLRGQGYGEGVTSGAQMGLFQGAQKNVNQYNTQQMSPEARLQRLMGSMQALQSGTTMPAQRTQQSMFAPLEQRHQQNQSEQGSGSWLNGIMGTLGGIAGQGGFGGLFGGQRQQPQQNQGVGYVAPNSSPFDYGYGAGMGNYWDFNR